MNMMRQFVCLLAGVCCVTAGAAEDWLRFRGPGGQGRPESTTTLPVRWSPEANLAWKTPLPGPGASSPIIVNGRIFVTCYSGYGLDQENPGEIENLMRHLVCADLETGKKLWQADVKAALPEDPYSGIGVTAHGYASHTPVSDGERVYAFFGKSGVHAFDLDGNKLWEAEVGKESDPTRWGSSSSPILHDGTVIITASAESQAIIGLDAKSGKEVWRQEAEGLDGMWGTPTLVPVSDDRTDLVMCVAKEMWGLDPASGKLRWFADATEAEHAYASVITQGTRIFAFTGRGGGSIAVDAGGKGDVSESKTVWNGRDTTSFASAVQHDSGIYVVSRNVLTQVDAKTGERITQVRMTGARSTGGRFGSLDYPSPIVVGDHLYSLNGSGQMFVFDLTDGPKQVAVNEVSAEPGEFRGSPAVSDGRLVMRSADHLYCVMDKGETVPEQPADTAAADTPDRPGRPGGNAPAGRPAGGGGGRGPGGGGGGQFDVMTFFNRMDTDGDKKLTAEEMKDNPMAERLKTLDKDNDELISEEEWRTGIGSLFNRGGGGGGGGGRGGRGGRGGGGGRYGGEDTRPERPQRPQSVDA